MGHHVLQAEKGRWLKATSQFPFSSLFLEAQGNKQVFSLT
jgi:hypothetical protein